MTDAQIPLADAVEVYFEAKERLFQADAEFRLLRLGPVICLHRHPGWPERDGFYALDMAADAVVAAVREYGPHPNHRITVFTRQPEALWEPFRQLGYQPLPDTQPLLGKRLINPSTSPVSLVQVRLCHTTAATDYWIELDGRSVCTGRSVTTSRETIYVCGMETSPVYHRRGLASAVLDRIHADAIAEGVQWSVLCSSVMGFPLYRNSGYDVLAQMQSFAPQTDP